MPSVERLPDDLVNKIAAGEVVERPASVVKELVENALDAAARSVHVEIEDGGVALVRVRDDGCGMAREDATLALERHATSKLRELSDLQSIATHGFRGEALPSIAAVSELLLRTRTESDSAGTEVAVEHGRPRHVRDAGHPRGTTVEVRDLFGAVPARRKFLRSAPTEASHVAETLTQLALARPGTGFSLRSAGRLLLDAPPAEGLLARIVQLFGAKLVEALVPVEGGADWAVVRGFVSRPDRPRPARPELRLFVNRRPVRDRALSRAVMEAYRSAGAGDRGFLAILFVEVPPHVVDVNVHPAKTEVRFADARTVWTAVERAVRAALSGGVRQAPEASLVETESQQGGLAAGAQLALDRYLERAASGQPRDEGERPWASTGPASGRQAASRSVDRVAEGPAADLQDGTGADGPACDAALSSVDGASATLATLRVLGQHRLTYIVASDGEELVLVDQHTAHERVRFERLQERAARHAVESQGLLSPAVVEVPPELRPILDAHQQALSELGYDVEPFGRGSSRLRAVPAMLGQKDPGPSLLRILRELCEREASDWTDLDARDRIAATLACHSAVRAGQGLNERTMAAIVEALRETAHPTLCPHGRPTVVRIPRDELSRWFGRTGWRRR